MMKNDPLNDRINALSVDRRKLFEIIYQKRRAGLTAQPVIPRRETSNSYPLSFAQQRIWFMQQFEPNSPMFNVPAFLHVTGRLDLIAFEQSLNEIVRRHEVLRTKFSVVNGQPVQVIAPHLPVSISKSDLHSLARDEKDIAVQRLAADETEEPFDLARGPLMRASLIQLDEEEQVVFLTMHHIISDAWSRSVFIRELTELYQAFSVQESSPLPDLPIQYADFAVWQRQWLQGHVLEQQLSTWKHQLSDLPPGLELPIDQPRSLVQQMKSDTEQIRLSANLTRLLKKSSREEGVTLFIMLLTAFKTLLYRYCGSENIVVGVPFANRQRKELEALIGFFVNVLPLNTRLLPNLTFRELLARVSAVTIHAYDHQELPLEKLVEALHPRREHGNEPLFQVIFTLEDQPAWDLKYPGLQIRMFETDGGIPWRLKGIDLALLMVDRTDELSGILGYNTHLFHQATIRSMVDQFTSVLEYVVVHPDCSLIDIPLQQLQGSVSKSRNVSSEDEDVSEQFNFG